MENRARSMELLANGLSSERTLKNITNNIDRLVSQGQTIEWSARDLDSNNVLTSAIINQAPTTERLIAVADNEALNVRNKPDGNNLIMVASINNHPEIINLLLERGLDINEQNNLGKTALMLAIEAKNQDLVKILIEEHNTDLEIRDVNGNTAYALATQKGSPAIVDYLNEKNANPHIINHDGITSLMMMVSSPVCPAFQVKKFLSSCSLEEINAKDNNGYTALMHAMEKRPAHIDNLLTAGATLDLDDPIALKLAEKSSNKKIKALLNPEQATTKAITHEAQSNNSMNDIILPKFSLKGLSSLTPANGISHRPNFLKSSEAFIPKKQESKDR